LKRRGLNAILLDKGCITNSLYNYPTNMVFFTTPELLEIGGIPMTSIGEKPVRGEALKYYRRVADHYSLDIHQYERVLRFLQRFQPSLIRRVKVWVAPIDKTASWTCLCRS